MTHRTTTDSDTASTTVMPEDETATSANADSDTGRQQPSSHRRKRLFVVLGVVVLLAALGYGAYWWFIGSRYISTDDAYVDANVAQITPLVAAAVTELRVKETQHVTAGQVLVELDSADARLAVLRAEAQLGQAIRRVQGYVATDAELAAQIASREANIASARSDVQRAQSDVQRRQALMRGGAVSKEDLTTAENHLREATAALNAAQAQLQAAQGARDANKALIAGVPVQNNPEVVAARAQFEQAKLDLQRTVIRAPMDGVIAQNTVQLGQLVQVGSSLMSVVPISRVYVDANFKEAQLRHMRIGQPVELVSDIYGSAVKFHGHVAGLAGGTGSAFSVIPAQNATGNWIKVVQRLPVRIELDPRELHKYPLRVGLSMTATADTAS
jgi:membrane fusion protein (multidrug efflux system)